MQAMPDAQTPEGAARLQHQAQQPQLGSLAITMADFTAAVGRVQPSVRREGFATTPDVTWADVGALDEVCWCSHARSGAAAAALGWSCLLGCFLLLA